MLSLAEYFMFIVFSTLIFLCFVVAAFFAYVVSFTVPVEFVYDEHPIRLFLMAKALCLSFKKKQGECDALDMSTNCRRIMITGKDCRIDEKLLKQYIQLCGCNASDKPYIPVCYPEVLFLPLILCLITRDEFPLSPLGLIHIKQSIVVYCDIQHLAREPIDLECYLKSVTGGPKGVQVEISLKVFDRREMCVWEGVTTLLSRSQLVQKKGQNRPADDGTNPELYDKLMKDGKGREMKVAGNTGVQYARVSGDWNPHHLWPFTASLLGYRRPIAHGMWTLQKALSYVRETKHSKVVEKTPVQVDASFKRPLFLPGKSLFSVTPQPSWNLLQFEVVDSSSLAPQLQGTVTELGRN